MSTGPRPAAASSSTTFWPRSNTSASTGSASTASTDDQSYTYDKLGEQTTFTDQNGTTHTYGYDVLGREVSDAATTLGSGVTGSTRRLGYSFNDAGLPFQQTSYYDTSGTNVALTKGALTKGDANLYILCKSNTGTGATFTYARRR